MSKPANMADNNLVGTLTGQINKLLTDSSVHDDMQKSAHTLAQTAFDKLELVTREEFDAQLAVLHRTQAKVKELEQQVEELLAQLNKE
jgi:BMFP domain-containing protein YqiC